MNCQIRRVGISPISRVKLGRVYFCFRRQCCFSCILITKAQGFSQNIRMNPQTSSLMKWQFIGHRHPSPSPPVTGQDEEALTCEVLASNALFRTCFGWAGAFVPPRNTSCFLAKSVDCGRCLTKKIGQD